MKRSNAINILFIESGYGTGGSSTFLFYFLKYLDRKKLLINALANALLKLIKDKNLSITMGKNARKRVKELFDIKKT